MTQFTIIELIRIGFWVGLGSSIAYNLLTILQSYMAFWALS